MLDQEVYDLMIAGYIVPDVAERTGLTNRGVWEAYERRCSFLTGPPDADEEFECSSDEDDDEDDDEFDLDYSGPMFHTEVNGHWPDHQSFRDANGRPFDLETYDSMPLE